MIRSDICAKFLDSLEYDLYPYQEEALLAWFESEGGVLITAPTGMGKTLIAEAAVFEALHTGRRMYYTTPLIALTDQKFREFQQKAVAWGFPREHVGLITGNRRVNPNAPVRVVVAEILLNHLLAGDEAAPANGGRSDTTVSGSPTTARDEGKTHRLKTGATHVDIAQAPDKSGPALAGGSEDEVRGALHRLKTGATHEGIGQAPDKSDRTIAGGSGPLPDGRGSDQNMLGTREIQTSRNGISPGGSGNDVRGIMHRLETGATPVQDRGSVLDDVDAVVMDEFHSFNDPERGVVWELSLFMLPKTIRLMLLSATVGNPAEFVIWLSKEHGRTLRLIQSDQRRVPLEFIWVEDKLLTEHLPVMVEADDEQNRSPALVFCFNREECWEVAERLKGLKLIGPAVRAEVEKQLERVDLTQGIGPKLRHMLISGVGVHHAGVLPKYKEIIEDLFLRKLIPFVICTETLAAGVNLPARSVVLSTLLKGKRGEKKLIFASSAHQMFGRAGRPQFDAQGYVYALAHEDDVKIHKWRKKYAQIDPKTKDPGLLRVKKDLERKKPTRRKTEQYWTEGQFRSLIAAGPARLASRSMIPYQVLIYWLRREGSLAPIRDMLTRRFDTPERLDKYQIQLDHMIGNLAVFGYVAKSESDDHITLNDSIKELMNFRSIDPVYGVYLAKHLKRGSLEEKMQALESVLPLPPVMERKVRLPDMDPGPLQQQVIEPALIQMGIALQSEEGGLVAVDEDEYEDYWAPEENQPKKLSLPEMLKLLYDAKLATPEDLFVQPKWVAGGIFESERDFYKYVRGRDLLKNEGLVLRHLLRLIILAGEFLTQSNGDPDYEQIGELATGVCQSIDASYTDRFLASEEEAKTLVTV